MRTTQQVIRQHSLVVAWETFQREGLEFKIEGRKAIGGKERRDVSCENACQIFICQLIIWFSLVTFESPPEENKDPCCSSCCYTLHVAIADGTFFSKTTGYKGGFRTWMLLFVRRVKHHVVLWVPPKNDTHSRAFRPIEYWSSIFQYPGFCLSGFSSLIPLGTIACTQEGLNIQCWP